MGITCYFFAEKRWIFYLIVSEILVVQVIEIGSDNAKVDPLLISGSESNHCVSLLLSWKYQGVFQIMNRYDEER